MSLTAALKSGLNQLSTAEDETSSGGWDPYPGEDAPAAKAAAPRRAKQPELDAFAEAANAPRLDPGDPPDPANRNQRPARTQRAPAPVVRGGGGAKTTWLSNPRKGQAVNAQQYVRELDRYLAEQNRRVTQDTLMDVSSREIEGLARLTSRARGRYLAKLLDSGGGDKATVHRIELEELAHQRETFEELTRGLDILKSAIAAGDVVVHGVIK